VAGQKRFALRAVPAFAPGDLYIMLQLPALPTPLKPQRVVVERVVDARSGVPVEPDPASPVVLLGDSFTNIYSVADMGWGDHAGLAEQLAYRLGRPLDVIAMNDGGVNRARVALARRPEPLAGKKVVIWQFAVRELAAGDWQSYPLELGRPASRPVGAGTQSRPAGAGQSVLRLRPGQTAVVTGRIVAMTRSPRPGTVAYKDHIMAVHLKDVGDAAGTVRGAEAVVFLWGMRDNQWTANARLREGQRVTARLRPWGDVEKKLGTIRRSEPADVDIDVSVFWCEEIK
jgi:alginate O-acetyltransferase complex protein AlgJ